MNVAPLGSDSTGNIRQSRVRGTASKYWCFTFWAPEGSMPQRGSIDHDNNLYDLYPEWDIFKQRVINSHCVDRFSYQLEWNSEGTNVHMQGILTFKTKGRPKETFCHTWDTKERVIWIKKSKNSTVAEYERYTWKNTDGTEEPNSHYANFARPTERTPIKDRMAGLELKDWQIFILNKIKEEPDARTIHWIYDLNGNTGKTTFAHYLTGLRADSLFVTGKAADIKSAIVEWDVEKDQEVNIVLFCPPREAEDYISYAAIEEIKDGIFFSGKYKSNMYRGNVKHVFVLANFKPKEEKLSRDRWDIRDITVQETYIF